MGLASTIRNLIGAAPQPEVDALRSAVQHAADAKATAEEMKALVASVREGHIRTVDEMRGELARLSARVEAMPEMRAQLETFVHSLGRTMTGAADRLDLVDNRIERLEQQARAQTEIIALSRSELDRQGRVVASLDAQMKTLEDAVVRLVAAADRSTALVREIDARRARVDRGDRTNRIVIVVLAVILVIALLR
ncbi:MAG: hypothetical protein ACO31E_02865 [Phycisphaerales bacterium]